MNQLVPHPDVAAPNVRQLTVDATRTGPHTLLLRYMLAGAIDALHVPASAPHERTDDLWKTTCFEAFILPKPGPNYLELNLSPSGRWAAYTFTAYREGMADAPVPTPEISVQRTGEALVLSAEVDTAGLVGAGPWRVGLTTVVDDLTGGNSYWSLRHPREQPEFHDAAGWVLELGAPA